MTLASTHAGTEIRIEGGSAGNPVAVDCALRALGARDGDRIRARFQAIDTDTLSYDRETAEREGRLMEVRSQARG